MANPKSTPLLRLKFQHRLGRAGLLVLGMSSLITGIWGGLLRVPLPVHFRPISYVPLAVLHAPQMILFWPGRMTI